MAHDSPVHIDDARAALPSGQLQWLRAGALEVALAPEAGGRLAQIRYQGMDWLIDAHEGGPAAIAWGCYPMVPWAGRIRNGVFAFDGLQVTLPPNFGAHAIHGTGFTRPWQVDRLEACHATLSLALAEDAFWPFGGHATQSIDVSSNRLELLLAVQAGDEAMPAVLGWHPWFRKPDQLLFAPSAMYPRDGQGIAVAPPIEPAPGPWDDCFINQADVSLLRAGQQLRLHANTDHWVVYDGAAHATCVEPQTGPPDGFTLAPKRLQPGERLELRFVLEWQNEAG